MFDICHRWRYSLSWRNIKLKRENGQGRVQIPHRVVREQRSMDAGEGACLPLRKQKGREKEEKKDIEDYTPHCDQAHSVNRFSGAGARTKRKETIRQCCSVTPVNSETECRFNNF